MKQAYCGVVFVAIFFFSAQLMAVEGSNANRYKGKETMSDDIQQQAERFAHFTFNLSVIKVSEDFLHLIAFSENGFFFFVDSVGEWARRTAAQIRSEGGLSEEVKGDMPSRLINDMQDLLAQKQDEFESIVNDYKQDREKTLASLKVIDDYYSKVNAPHLPDLRSALDEYELAAWVVMLNVKQPEAKTVFSDIFVFIADGVENFAYSPKEEAPPLNEWIEWDQAVGNALANKDKEKLSLLADKLSSDFSPTDESLAVGRVMRHGDTQRLQLLLDAGFKVSVKWVNLLRHKPHAEAFIKALFGNDGFYDNTEENNVLARLLYDAIYSEPQNLHNIFDMMKIVASTGERIVYRDSYQTCESLTELGEALEMSLLDVLKLISLDDPNKPNDRGQTCLHLAAEKGDAALLEHLTNSGADVSVQDWNQDTPLHLAIKHGSKEIVDIFVRHGADVNVKGNYTPLVGYLEHAAREKVDFDFVMHLINNGFDPSLPISWGERTAMNLIDEETGTPAPLIEYYFEKDLLDQFITNVRRLMWFNQASFLVPYDKPMRERLYDFIKEQEYYPKNMLYKLWTVGYEEAKDATDEQRKQLGEARDQVCMKLRDVDGKYEKTLPLIEEYAEKYASNPYVVREMEAYKAHVQSFEKKVEPRVVKKDDPLDNIKRVMVKGQYYAAIKYITDAIESGDTRPDLYFRLLESHYMLKKPKNFVETYQQYESVIRENNYKMHEIKKMAEALGVIKKN